MCAGLDADHRVGRPVAGNHGHQHAVGGRAAEEPDVCGIGLSAGGRDELHAVGGGAAVAVPDPDRLAHDDVRQERAERAARTGAAADHDGADGGAGPNRSHYRLDLIVLGLDDFQRDGFRTAHDHGAEVVRVVAEVGAIDEEHVALLDAVGAHAGDDRGELGRARLDADVEITPVDAALRQGERELDRAVLQIGDGAFDEEAALLEERATDRIADALGAFHQRAAPLQLDAVGFEIATDAGGVVVGAGLDANLGGRGPGVGEHEHDLAVHRRAAEEPLRLRRGRGRRGLADDLEGDGHAAGHRPAGAVPDPDVVRHKHIEERRPEAPVGTLAQPDHDDATAGVAGDIGQYDGELVIGGGNDLERDGNTIGQHDHGTDVLRAVAEVSSEDAEHVAGTTGVRGDARDDGCWRRRQRFDADVQIAPADAPVGQAQIKADGVWIEGVRFHGAVDLNAGLRAERTNDHVTNTGGATLESVAPGGIASDLDAHGVQIASDAALMIMGTGLDLDLRGQGPRLVEREADAAIAGGRTAEEPLLRRRRPFADDGEGLVRRGGWTRLVPCPDRHAHGHIREGEGGHAHVAIAKADHDLALQNASGGRAFDRAKHHLDERVIAVDHLQGYGDIVGQHQHHAEVLRVVAEALAVDEEHVARAGLVGRNAGDDGAGLGRGRFHTDVEIAPADPPIGHGERELHGIGSNLLRGAIHGHHALLHEGAADRVAEAVGAIEDRAAGRHLDAVGIQIAADALVMIMRAGLNANLAGVRPLVGNDQHDLAVHRRAAEKPRRLRDR